MPNRTGQSADKSPGLPRVLVVVLLLGGNTMAGVVRAWETSDADAIPHVNAKAREHFLSYQYAGKHKAFAIAPGGVWAWQADAISAQAAEQQALDNCQANTRQECVLYALNDEVVFDSERWPTLWGRDSSADDSADAPTGARVGERFFDIAYKDAGDSTRSLGESRGRMLFVHFWGSWCPPCLREFPSLQALHEQLEARLPDQVEMILLQVREPFDQAQRWAERNRFSGLPLYDSGSTGSDDTGLALADGEEIEDRRIARVFPGSYVLDGNGIVLFSHFGPVEDWLEYLPFFEHAAQQSEYAPAGSGTD